MPIRFPPLVLITDKAFGDAHTARTIAHAAEALPPGSLGVQLRAKDLKSADLVVKARVLRRLTEGLGVALSINGDPSVAADVGADGVHLGHSAPSIEETRRACGPDVFVSVSAHDGEELRRALIEGADGVLVSPIYTSPGKGRARGSRALREAKEIGKDRFLVYALGGIEADNVARCRAAGADGVAVIRALLGANAKDVARVARELNAPFRSPIAPPEGAPI